MREELKSTLAAYGVLVAGLQPLRALRLLPYREGAEFEAAAADLGHVPWGTDVNGYGPHRAFRFYENAARLVMLFERRLPSAHQPMQRRAEHEHRYEMLPALYREVLHSLPKACDLPDTPWTQRGDRLSETMTHACRFGGYELRVSRYKGRSARRVTYMLSMSAPGVDPAQLPSFDEPAPSTPLAFKKDMLVKAVRAHPIEVMRERSVAHYCAPVPLP